MTLDELKARHKAEEWWVKFAEFFKDLGDLKHLTQKRDTLETAIGFIRGKYIRKGRPYGWRKAVG